MTTEQETFGNYRTLIELGRGGFDIDYRAIDTTADHEVALISAIPQPKQGG